MVIDCDSCEMAGLACHDCVVSVLLGTPQPGEGPPALDEDHARAIGVLADSGLVPPLRLAPVDRRVG